MTNRTPWALLPAAAVALLAGCGNFGRVNQGKVVHYDRDKGVVTLIQDSNYTDPAKPKFDLLPAVTVRTPLDPHEMGPLPEAGNLLSLDLERKQIELYDPATRRIVAFEFRLLEQRANVSPDARIPGVQFPAVDRQQKTVTLYLRPRQTLITCAVPDEFLALPEDTWKSGDEVRYYYKDPGQALRMMNVTRTDISKKEK
jgi:hypothetical protein